MSQQWYAQRMRSESHTSSEYQDASEYLDLDIGPLLQPSYQHDDTTAAVSGNDDAALNGGASGKKEDDDDDDAEIDDKNVGIGGEDDSGGAEDNEFTNLKIEKLEVSSYASPPIPIDSVSADDAGSTGNSSNESL